MVADDPEVVAVSVAVADEPDSAFAVVAIVNVSEPQASLDIVVVFLVLLPVSLVVVEVDSLEHPKFFDPSNIDFDTNYSSSVEVVD